MITVTGQYKGFNITIQDDAGIKNAMLDAVAAIEYAALRDGLAPLKDKVAGEKPEKEEVRVDDTDEAEEDETDEQDTAAEEEAAKVADQKARKAATAKKRAAAKKKAEAEEAEADQGEEEEDEPEEKAPEVTDAQLRDAIMNYVDANGAVKGKALVKEHGGDRLSEVPDDQRKALLSAAISGAL